MTDSAERTYCLSPTFLQVCLTLRERWKQKRKYIDDNNSERNVADKHKSRRSMEIVRSGRSISCGRVREVRFTRKKGTTVFTNAWQYWDERGKIDGIRLRSRRHFLLSSHSPSIQRVIVCYNEVSISQGFVNVLFRIGSFFPIEERGLRVDTRNYLEIARLL